MKSPRLRMKSSFSVADEMFIAGYKLACDRFQASIRKEQKRMAALVANCDEDGCWCHKICKCEECTMMH